MTELIARLKQRKLVQWALAYVAAAFALIQVADVVALQSGWPESLRRGITLFAGFARKVGFAVLWDKYGPPDLFRKNAVAVYACQ